MIVAKNKASPLRIVPRFPPESKILTHRVQVLDEGSGDPKVLVLFSKDKIQRRAFDCSEDKERISLTHRIFQNKTQFTISIQTDITEHSLATQRTKHNTKQTWNRLHTEYTVIYFPPTFCFLGLPTFTLPWATKYVLICQFFCS